MQVKMNLETPETLKVHHDYMFYREKYYRMEALVLLNHKIHKYE